MDYTIETTQACKVMVICQEFFFFFFFFVGGVGDWALAWKEREGEMLNRCIGW